MDGQKKLKEIADSIIVDLETYFKGEEINHLYENRALLARSSVQAARRLLLGMTPK